MEKMFDCTKLIDCELCRLGFQTSSGACHRSLSFDFQEGNIFTAKLFDYCLTDII